MNKDIIYFAENFCGVKLLDWQKDLLRQGQEANDKGELMLVNLGRRQGGQLVNYILINFQIWSKNQQIAILEKALELACDCFYNNFGKALEPYCECNTSSEAMQKHFKTKAKEMKSE